jgi:hypothetical protein
VEPVNGITAQVNALDAFSWNFYLRPDVFMLADNGVSRALNTAWPMVEVQIAPDVLEIPITTALELKFAFRTLLRHGAE